jgi:lysyl-tRNA synthetase class 2
VSSRVTGATGWTLAALVGVDLTCAIISIIKGKLWTGFIGIWVPIVAEVGAIRLARPGSPRASRAYADKPKKQARAEAREQRGRRYAQQLKRWFYDLIAGKPSLPPLSLGKEESDEEK